MADLTTQSRLTNYAALARAPSRSWRHVEVSVPRKGAHFGRLRQTAAAVQQDSSCAMRRSARIEKRTRTASTGPVPEQEQPPTKQPRKDVKPDEACICTVGHSKRSGEQFVEILQSHNIELLAGKRLLGYENPHLA
jgi:hypothetical protein